MELRNRIREEALKIGFDAIGFAEAQLAAHIGQDLKEFCQTGMHGDMGWLEAKQELRAQPKNLWPDAKSVIALGISYGGEDPLLHQDNASVGIISIYARHRDYHEIIKKKLRQLAHFVQSQGGGELKIFIDTAPVMEKPLSQRAGIGWQGKHTNLVSRELGSWFFLGIILTSLNLEEDAPEEDHCGSCQKCLDICPTQAFLGPRKLDARRCISYLTIEHKEAIPYELRPLLGNRIYGCDDCLAVCPWNKFSQKSHEIYFHARQELTAPLLKDLVLFDDTNFRRFFSKSPIKRIGRHRFIRNVLYAIGNSADSSSIPTVKNLLGDSSPLVRGAAVWALSRLISKDQLALLQGEEENQSVKEEWTRALQ